MRYKVQPDDFIVEELAQLPLAPEGDFAIYRVEKRNVTTLQVQTHIASQLRRRSADVHTPALKDKTATAIQYLGLRGTGPTELEGPGFRARFVGRSRRALRPSDLTGNRFTVILRDLSSDDAERISDRIGRSERSGLPNYFDEQRFGSYSSDPEAPDPFIGKTILRRDAEGAVRTYLAYPFVGDPPPVRAFKAVARQHWGDWAYLLREAPRPSNFRSLLTFLKDHPQDYRKTLNLIPRRILSLYLVAYQSYLWNQIAGGYLGQELDHATPVPTLTIVNLALPFYQELPEAQHSKLSNVYVPLPGHRAVYADPSLTQVVTNVLASEGLQLNDLKARILRRAYLPKGRRPLLLHPADIAADPAQEDSRFPGQWMMQVRFTLPSGAYATLVLKRLGVTSRKQSSAATTSSDRGKAMKTAKGNQEKP